MTKTPLTLAAALLGLACAAHAASAPTKPRA